MSRLAFASEKLQAHLSRPEVKAEISDCCMVCQKKSDIWEFLNTGDENSCEGMEFWSYCPECEIDTFHRIPLYDEV